MDTLVADFEDDLFNDDKNNRVADDNDTAIYSKDDDCITETQQQ